MGASKGCVASRPINDGLGLGGSGTCALFLDCLFEGEIWVLGVLADDV